jgi:LPXTG-motif cell wall-anchored protein
MRKSVSVALAAVLAGLALVTAPASFGADTDGFTLSVSPEPVRSGGAVTVTLSAPTDCAWTVTWNGEARSGEGTSFTTTFTAPTVTESTRLPLKADCLYVPTTTSTPTATPSLPPGSLSQILEVTVPGHWTRTVQVTVLPENDVAPPVDNGDGDSNGGGTDLPSTGGPRLWLAVTGVAAVLLGAVLVRRRRTGSAQGGERVLAGTPDLR